MKIHPRHKLRARASQEVLSCVIRLEDSGLTHSEIVAALARQLAAMTTISQSGPRTRSNDDE